LGAINRFKDNDRLACTSCDKRREQSATAAAFLASGKTRDTFRVVSSWQAKSSLGLTMEGNPEEPTTGGQSHANVT
jgi:hypothetical protein